MSLAFTQEDFLVCILFSKQQIFVSLDILDKINRAQRRIYLKPSSSEQIILLWLEWLLAQ